MSDNVTAHHPLYYFPDGNLVLSCRSGGDDSPFVYFRIHKDYLSAQSTVISDMLSFPQAEDREMYDGLPVVRLSTSPDDLAKFLSFFYDPSSAILDKDEHDVAHNLLGALVLADMLLIEPITKVISDRIRQDWEINSVQHWRSKVKAFATALDPDDECNTHLYVEPASVLHAARRFNETLITPMLIFELAFRDPYRQHDNLVENKFNASWSALGARWELLSSSERTKVGRFRDEFLNILAARLPHLRSECTTKYHPTQADCTKYFREEVDGAFGALLRGRHPLRLLENSKLNGTTSYMRSAYEGDIDIYEDAICIPCGRAWDETLERLQIDLFADIAVIFQRIW